MSYARHLATAIICMKCFIFSSAGALAGEPAALVESVAGAPQGIEPMDYVSAGKIISLGPHERLVIDYLQSCIRETIAGGTVTIGLEHSTVTSGRMERERVRCDGGSLNLSPDQARASSVAVFRVPPKSHPLPPGTVIQRRLYGTGPVIDLDGGNRIVIERLDRTETPLDLVIPVDRMARGRFYDLASDGHALAPGGVYRATAGDRSIVFQIDRTAKPGRTPIVGRLLRF